MDSNWHNYFNRNEETSERNRSLPRNANQMAPEAELNRPGIQGRLIRSRDSGTVGRGTFLDQLPPTLSEAAGPSRPLEPNHNVGRGTFLDQLPPTLSEAAGPSRPLEPNRNVGRGTFLDQLPPTLSEAAGPSRPLEPNRNVPAQSASTVSSAPPDYVMEMVTVAPGIQIPKKKFLPRFLPMPIGTPPGGQGRPILGRGSLLYSIGERQPNPPPGFNPLPRGPIESGAASEMAVASVSATHQTERPMWPPAAVSNPVGGAANATWAAGAAASAENQASTSYTVPAQTPNTGFVPGRSAAVGGSSEFQAPRSIMPLAPRYTPYAGSMPGGRADHAVSAAAAPAAERQALVTPWPPAPWQPPRSGP